MKTLIRREFNASSSNELKARTKEKQWTVALSDIAPKRNSGQWHSPTYPTGQESKPLLSLDYVPDTIALRLT
ncbi:unnamed protein product [Rodentolepis nana]|uniref:Uncharacterized protein n=1 Tax=Rodentolepis nana TaxID=102285 RepID=A0A0R3U0P4_RODNA|nr:unnamed protein product [Rodentolepis nana]